MAVLIEFISLRIGASAELLCITVMNLWIPKMLEIGVNEQLLDSQEGLGSTELVFVLDYYFFLSALHAKGTRFSLLRQILSCDFILP
jgi:hypothetical protein